MESGRRRSLGSLATAAITGLSLALQTGLAAAVGIILAREFGRTAETDGFFAAFGVFVVLGLVASVVRLVVLPALARARADRRLASETATWTAILAAGGLPLLVAAIAFPRPIADLLTGPGPPEALDTAARVLPILVGAAVGQIFAGLFSSALAALDDYLTSAVAFGVGSLAGLVFILFRLETAGVLAVAWGMLVGAVVAQVMLVGALALRARGAAMPLSGVATAGSDVGSRVGTAARGCALPFALQASYLLCVPLAARDGVGAVTSFGFAYLGGSSIVSVTAASFALVTAVPLTRAGADAAQFARHLKATFWVALLIVAAAVGVFAVAGGPVLSVVLGDEFLGAGSAQIGQLIAYLGLWMASYVGVLLAFPLVFVAGRYRNLPWLALITIGCVAPIAVAGHRIFGLNGLTLALAASTVVAFAGMLFVLGVLRPVARGLLGPALFSSGVALLAFGLADLAVDGVPAAALGLALFIAATGIARPRGLQEALSYFRTLR